MSQRKYLPLTLICSLLLISGGCKPPVPPVVPPPPPPPQVVPPPPPPPPPQPVIGSFTAEPGTIQRGQAATLRWSTSNATDVSISAGIGAVAASGSRQVLPTSTTNYELVAKGPGGVARRPVTVTVTAPPPPPPPPPPPKPRPGVSDRIAKEVSDVYFDYDKYDVREDARSVLTRNADALKSILSEFPTAVITIEGHCDERGSAEYNLGLGDRRSTAAKDFMAQLGVSADRLRTISYGKERPQCTDQDEACWQRNRRVHFTPGQ